MHRISDGCKRGVEVGMGYATAFARAAIMAGATVILGLSEVGRTCDCDRATELLFYAIPKNALLTGKRHRRLELPVRKPFQALGHASNAYVSLYQVVVRCKIFVA